MLAIKARFDGKKIVLPTATRNAPPGEVIVVFTEAGERENKAWLKAQEAAFRRVWENDEDAIYDTL